MNMLCHVCVCVCTCGVNVCVYVHVYTVWVCAGVWQGACMCGYAHVKARGCHWVSSFIILRFCCVGVESPTPFAIVTRVPLPRLKCHELVNGEEINHPRDGFKDERLLTVID